MALRQGVPSKKLGSSDSKAANSTSSSTTSSSKQFLETSIDGQSSPASSSVRSKPHNMYFENVETERYKENVTVTVRFRPLSPREIRQGEEIAWYPDGETILRNEHNPTIAYAYDRVFGPTTTTRQVYDVAAQHAVSGAMEGINGTIFAYGVTSSGKTHSMHGDQRSPGIIPLAVKDAFSIIQETPSREFLLRISYLEIYNEVVNDLLNPAGQNLRILEDAQGTFVEGIKEEVVLSPAHAFSLIAAGEEHRHVGSTNFNLQSSRSHTIFTLTVESSPYNEEGAVNLSQLNLIDLAGSESSKAESTGMRCKEGSYINKSLLTLGTVISKLTDGRATHIPYRDSKLTRLLQSSLNGHGHVSLICTVTPASSNSEETHNTLKFAHRAKHIEIQAAHNKINDEKSLIKKYQNEIRCLKEELEQLKTGIATYTCGDDTVFLNQKQEDGQAKLQSQFEQEEEAKAALLGRIQRLTKLILVSSKISQSSTFSHHTGSRRRHSFGEEELAYLPHRRRDLILDDENIEVYVSVSVEGKAETSYDTLKEEKRTKKHGLLNWLKIRKRGSALGTMISTSDKSSGVISVSRPSTPQAEISNFQMESKLSQLLLAESCSSTDILSEARQDREVSEDHISGQETPQTSLKTFDQIDLLREQQKILSGEVELHLRNLKMLSEDAARYPQRAEIQVEITKLNNEIKGKNKQIALLEKQIAESIIGSESNIDKFEISETIAELTEQLNEKSFELEVKATDNRIIQEQLNQKVCEIEGLQEIIVSLKQQLSDAQQLGNLSPIVNSQGPTETQSSTEEFYIDKSNTVLEDSNEGLLLEAQETEIEELKQKVERLTEAKVQLELQNQKLGEESSYAKGLASAAAVELKALSDEVAKLMNHNEKLAAESAAAKSSPTQRRNSGVTARNGRRESQVRRPDQSVSPSQLKKELALSREREFAYESTIAQKDQIEAELQRKVEESKQREVYLEDELANMWVLVAKLNRSHAEENDVSDSTTEGFGI